MMKFKNDIFIIIGLTCGIVTSVLGGLILTGSIMGYKEIFSLGENFIPMANETALLYIFL